MCRITLSYNEKDSAANKQLAALLETGLFTQIEVSSELDIDYSDQSLYEDDIEALPGEKELYTPEDLRKLLINDLNSIYGAKDAAV